MENITVPAAHSMSGALIVMQQVRQRVTFQTKTHRAPDSDQYRVIDRIVYVNLQWKRRAVCQYEIARTFRVRRKKKVAKLVRGILNEHPCVTFHCLHICYRSRLSIHMHTECKFFG